MTRYPEVEVSGSTFEMGLQMGEAAREEIRGFSQVALDRVQLTSPVSREEAITVARDCFSYVRGFAPHLLEELDGMSRSSGVSTEELMLLQIRNQLQAAWSEGCTSFGVFGTGSAKLDTKIGQNWDNDPELDPFTLVLTRRPDDKPAFMTITQAGLVGYIGVSATGIGVCMNSLPAPSRLQGVPHYFIVRALYECESLEECLQTVSDADRALPGNLMIATPQGAADLEVTVEQVRLLQDLKTGVITHSNHCLHPDLVSINDEFPDLIESHPRKRRIDDLMALSRNGSLAVSELQEILRDHEGYPRSICRHENDHPITGFWTSVFSVVIEVEAARMYVTRGNPCEHPYEVYQLLH